MTTVTQSRLLTLARHHKSTRGRWPDTAAEIFHRQVTASRAVSIYRMRDGHGYRLAWICGANDEVIVFADEPSALGYAHRVITDLEALGGTP